MVDLRACCTWLCLLGTFVLGLSASEAKVESPSASERVVLLHIDDEINPLQERYVERALADAAQYGATTLITRISSFGGRVDNAHSICQAITNAADAHQLRTIAFVDGHAISAGAMIAYSHREVYLTPTASIGDIGVIFQSPEGGIEMAPEKIETFVRAYLQTIGEHNGWDSAIIRKMTALDQDLWEIRHNPEDTSTWQYVLGQDIDSYLADHPELDREDKSRVLVRWPAGRLLTFSPQDALRYRMATGQVNNLAMLYQQLGLDPAQVQDLGKSTTEQLADRLSGFAPLLAGLAVLFIIFELKTPGVGLFAILGAISGALFLFCQFYLELAGNLELVLIVLGLALVIVEIFTVFSGGILGLIGFGLALFGLLLAFMPDATQFDPSALGWGDQLMGALVDSLFTLVVLAAGLLVIISQLPRLRALKRLSVAAELAGTSAGSLEQREQELVGQEAIAETLLRPNGSIRLADGHIVSAHLVGGATAEPGTRLRIRALRFGECLVEPLA